MTERPSVTVAVVMEREAQPNRWEDWRFRIVDVVLHEEPFGTAPRVLRDDGKLRRTLFPGFRLELFRDEGEGYHLNLTTGTPVWFVVWRGDDEDPSSAQPVTVSLSYNEAGRWLDAQEHVDNVPLQGELAAWLQAYTDEHYRPEPKKRRRPASFLPPDQRH
jgi:Protein of unknown function (DUF3305)